MLVSPTPLMLICLARNSASPSKSSAVFLKDVYSDLSINALVFFSGGSGESHSRSSPVRRCTKGGVYAIVEYETLA